MKREDCKKGMVACFREWPMTLVRVKSKPDANGLVVVQRADHAQLHMSVYARYLRPLTAREKGQ
jgi:hypothetical protein